MSAQRTILLQTTIPHTEDDWHVGRFSLLRDTLQAIGNGDGSPRYRVIVRNREPDANGDDPVLSTLPERDIDELWILGVDTGDGLSQNDVAGVLAFRERGGGVLTARDHQDLGACLRSLGTIGNVNHFHNYNPECDARCKNDDRDNPNISYPNYHSGANGNYQRIDVVEPTHPLLHSDRSASGMIEYFPAHPHEGAVDVPEGNPYARVIARGRSAQTGCTFNIAVAIEGEPCSRGPMGRVVAESTFHHFANLNWDPSLGAPSFVTDIPGNEVANDPSRLETFKDYVRNIARWLEPD